MTALALFGAYLLGSIPFAILVSRVMGLPDPRGFGSGNPGATNVLRSGSRLGALLTLLGDSSKGAVAVLLGRLMAERAGLDPGLAAWCGACAFLGHLFPFTLRFRGGKGVATFLGTLIALMPLLGAIACGTWLAMAAVFRFSSLAAVTSCIVAAAAAWVLDAGSATALAATGMSAMLLLRHRSNISNLLAGRETRIGQQRKPGTAGEAGPR